MDWMLLRLIYTINREQTFKHHYHKHYYCLRKRGRLTDCRPTNQQTDWLISARVTSSICSFYALHLYSLYFGFQPCGYYPHQLQLHTTAHLKLKGGRSRYGEHSSLCAKHSLIPVQISLCYFSDDKSLQVSAVNLLRAPHHRKFLNCHVRCWHY